MNTCSSVPTTPGRHLDATKQPSAKHVMRTQCTMNVLSGSVQLVVLVPTAYYIAIVAGAACTSGMLLSTIPFYQCHYHHAYF